MNTQESSHADAMNTTPTSVSPRRRRRGWIPVLAVIVVAIALGGYAIGKRIVLKSYAEGCRAALRAKDWPRVEELAPRWQWWDRQDAAPGIYLAEAAQQQGDLEQAVAYLDELPDADPKTPRALLEQSNLLFGPLNRPIQGAASCERALKLSPRLQDAYRRLIYFYAYTLQRRKMVNRIYDAIKNDCDLPEMYLYLVLQDSASFKNAYDENTKWLRGSPDEELFLVAQAIFGVKLSVLKENEKRETDSATGGKEPWHKKIIDRCFQRFPNNLDLFVYYLQTSSSDGDIDRVAEILSKLPPEAAEDDRFWRFKGWLHSTRGELTEAVAAYQKALEINPYDLVSQHQWAAVERRLNHPQHVETLETVSREGQELRRDILRLPDIMAAPQSMFQRIATYSANCGDHLVADKLFVRLEEP